MGIELHIEELVLHGFPGADRHLIAAAMQHELSRLLTASGHAALARGQLSFERVNAGAFEMKSGAKPQATGKQIARAVFRGMRQSSLPTSVPQQARPRTGGHQQ